MRLNGGERRAARRRVRAWLLWLMAVVAAAFLCSRCLFQLLLIQGESMAPAYHNLQLAVLDKRERALEPGDVVAFQCQALSAVLVKRVVACPGDTVAVERGTLRLNGETSRVYSREGVFEYAGLLSVPRTLGEDEFVVIGDNIGRSKDSRYPQVGVVHRREILGKVLWPVRPVQ